MSLTTEDFFEEFEKRELVEVKLATMGDRTIFLRGLDYAKAWRFRILATKIAKKRASEIFNIANHDNEVDDADLIRAEDYLIYEAMCHDDGSDFFKDRQEFAEFRKTIKPDVASEIIFHIENNNELTDHFENKDALLESLKAKKKSS